MNAITPTRSASSGAIACFDDAAKRAISAAYPLSATSFAHHFSDHPLLTLPALADLADMLPATSVEYARSDVPIGTLPDDAPANGLSAAETIRTIADNRSWAVLKNIEQRAEYDALLRALLSELRDIVVPRTGEMLNLQGFIFVSSPNAMTPYHFDPEHNILMQLQGSKTMHAFPAHDPRYAPQQEHERYHTGGHRGLPWDDAMDAGCTPFPLAPGEAVLMPVMAPHYVRNGPEPSISLSITWRSEWSYREGEAHVANAWLRKRGFSPAMPPAWPAHARAKTLLWRAARKMGVVG